MYIVLEPCHHTGKTGPCSVALAEAGVTRVVCAMREDNSAARGGAEWLRERGVEVEFGVCERAAQDLNAVHLSMYRRGRPFLALKYAMSLDARLSRQPGEPTQVTSGPAITEAHRLRAGHDAVMIGIGTALADDPQLTVREWKAPRVTPLRVVIDSSLRLPADGRLVASAADDPVLAITSPDASEERVRELENRDVEIARVSRDPSGGLDLGAVLATLWDRGIRSVLCEGGGELGSGLLTSGLVDRLYAFIAPRLFGEPGVPAFQARRGILSQYWRLIRRQPLDEVTLLVFGPENNLD
jgi:diaminohydroxyphosphoribosylaminopyrimidine deaminase/5-amino-6-(5-phosphoribosylamino)uracil reductase